MHLPWGRVLKLLRCGTVLYDSRFHFPDGLYKPKWIVLLTGLLDDQSYVYCLTTTQLQTYRGSYSAHLECIDPALGGKRVIIELERLALVPARAMETRYDNGILQYKGQLDPALVEQILGLIEDSERIPEYLKDLIINND